MFQSQFRRLARMASLWPMCIHAHQLDVSMRHISAQRLRVKKKRVPQNPVFPHICKYIGTARALIFLW